MILIIKEYYPDYDNDNRCDCDTGTEIIETVLELITNLSEQDLMNEYEKKLEAMVKLRTAYKSTTTKGVLTRWKHETKRGYSFINFLMENYEYFPLKWIEIKE